MDDFDPAPSTDPPDATKRWQTGTDTFGRVYDTLLGITTPTLYIEIADRANCSSTAAKKHLDRLAKMGIARADSESRPTRYTRNDGYLEWQEASRIARELSVDEIVDRVRTLEAERDAYEERFGTDDPTAVSALDQHDHTDIHNRMSAISDW